MTSIVGSFKKFLNDNDSYVTDDLFNTIVSWLDLNKTYIMGPLFLNVAKFVYEIAKKSSSEEQKYLPKYDMLVCIMNFANNLKVY